MKKSTYLQLSHSPILLTYYSSICPLPADNTLTRSSDPCHRGHCRHEEEVRDRESFQVTWLAVYSVFWDMALVLSNHLFKMRFKGSCCQASPFKSTCHRLQIKVQSVLALSHHVTPNTTPRRKARIMSLL